MEDAIRPDEEPDELYRRGLHFLPLDIPPNSTVTVQNTTKDQDGPCELLFREQPMPPIDDLDRTTKYSLGVAMRFIGYALDQVEMSPKQALRTYGELCESADAQMQRYRLGECGPFLVDDLVDALLLTNGALFEHVDVRMMIRNYVSHALKMKGQPDRRDLKEASEYIAESVKIACEELLGHVPTFHIKSEVFDQSEHAQWSAVAADTSHLPNKAFLIAVDGETWLPISGTPYSAQTKWLLVDARNRHWGLYERAKFRGAGVRAEAAQVCGAVCDSQTGSYHPIESTSTFVEENGSTRAWGWNKKEAGRLVRVAMTFMILLRSERVVVAPDRALGHWNVILPPGLSVDDIVTDVLRRKEA